MRIETRNDGSIEISGYVNVVERQSNVLMDYNGKFVETVKTGTFQRALDATENVKMLLNHNVNHELAETRAGTLTLNEDNVGLYAKALIKDTEVIEAANKNQLTGWSFGFSDNNIQIEERDGMNYRTLTDIQLLEVSLLTLEPAYIATSVQTRAENVEKRYTPDVVPVEDEEEQKNDNNEEDTTITSEYRTKLDDFIKGIRK